MHNASTNFWYKQLSFLSVEELRKHDRSDVLSADIISINQKINGGIFHSVSMEWWGNIGGITEPENFFRSKKARKLLPKNLAYFSEQGYIIQTKPLDLTLFEEFRQLYEETTLKKERALYYDLEGKLKSAILVNKPAYVCGLFKGSVLESGIAFVLESNNTVARVMFGAKKNFDVLGGVGGVLEYALLQFCIENHISLICHGLGKNPAGLISHAGVFEFKTRYGFSAYPAKYWQTSFILNPAIALSDLVFVTLLNEKIGYLVVSEDEPEVVKNKYLAKEVVDIEVVSPQFVKTQALEFLAQQGISE